MRFEYINSPLCALRYRTVLPMTLVYVGVLYLVTSCVGYIAYGDAVYSAVIYSLPQSGQWVRLVELLLGVMVLFTFPVQFWPVVETMERSDLFQDTPMDLPMKRKVSAHLEIVKCALFFFKTNEIELFAPSGVSLRGGHAVRNGCASRAQLRLDRFPHRLAGRFAHFPHHPEPLLPCFRQGRFPGRKEPLAHHRTSN
jgi:hypothetical protein